MFRRATKTPIQTDSEEPRDREAREFISSVKNLAVTKLFKSPSFDANWQKQFAGYILKDSTPHVGFVFQFLTTLLKNHIHAFSFETIIEVNGPEFDEFKDFLDFSRIYRSEFVSVVSDDVDNPRGDPVIRLGRNPARNVFNLLTSGNGRKCIRNYREFILHMLRSDKLTVEDCEVFREALKLEREGHLLSIIDDLICDFASKIAQPNFWDITERDFLQDDDRPPFHVKIAGVYVDVSPSGSEISLSPSGWAEPEDDRVRAKIREAVASSRHDGPYFDFRDVAEHPVFDEEETSQEGSEDPLGLLRGVWERRGGTAPEGPKSLDA